MEMKRGVFTLHILILFLLLCKYVSCANYAFIPAAEQNVLSGRDVRKIMVAALRLIRGNIPGTSGLIQRGQLFTSRVDVSVGTVLVRVILRNSWGGGDEYCALRPDPSDTVGCFSARRALTNLLLSAGPRMFQYLAIAMWNHSPRYIIEYMLETDNRPASAKSPMANHTMRVQENDEPTGVAICGLNGLTGGYRGMPYTTLFTGSTIYSPNSKYRLSMQPDCNLVMYAHEETMDRFIWGTGTVGRGTNCQLRMQPDGIMRLVDGNENELWRSTVGKTVISGSLFLIVQDDCNIVVYTATGLSKFEPVWSLQDQSRC